jgi:sugar lactone lactonase YvrE
MFRHTELSGGEHMAWALERVPVAAGVLPEGPHWDAAAGRVYWVDIPGGRVHFLDESGGQRSWEVGQPVAAVAGRAGGGLVLAVRDGFAALDLATGQVSALAGVEPDRPGNRMNDGACDRAGRFFAGTKAEDDAPGAGALYRLDPDHVVTLVVAGVTISNGIGWSPDEQLMYYVDSPTRRVDVFDYDPASGAIGGRRPFARLPSADAMPDGLAVDAEGGVWVALWGGSAVHRYDAAGRLDQVVEVPHVNVTSCAFGGPGLDLLYVTAAAGPGAAEGALYRGPAGVAGLPAYPFRG